MKRKKSRSKNKPAMITGIAWYRPEQWQRLRQVASDRGDLEERYEEWLTLASQKLAELKQAGFRIEKMEVDVEELLSWCAVRGLPVDASARSQFVADKLRVAHISKR